MRNSLLKMILIMLVLFCMTGYTDTLAAGCIGDECGGLNPNTMQCTVSNSSSYNIGGGVIQTRISSNCQAKWARTKNTSGYNRYIGASIYFGCQDYCYDYSVVSPALVGNSETVYTGMVPWVATPVKSCGRVNQSSFSPPVPKIDGIYCAGVS